MIFGFIIILYLIGLSKLDLQQVRDRQTDRSQVKRPKLTGVKPLPVITYCQSEEKGFDNKFLCISL